MYAFKSFFKDHEWFADLLLLGFLSLLFYSFWLGSHPLFNPDESRYSEVAREMLATGDFITPRVDGVAFLDKPILFYWLQSLALALFGLKEWVVRFFPMLFGVAGVLITYIAGKQLFNRQTAILSALMLATTPLYFAGAHYANLDLEVAIFITGTLFSFLMAIKSHSPNRLYFLFAAYIFSALAFLTKGMIGIVLPTIIIGSWLLLTKQLYLLRKIHLFIGLLLFAIIVLPWYIFVQKANPAFFHYFFITQQVTRFLSAGEFNNKTPIWFYFPIVFLGFIPWSFFLLQAIYINSKKWLCERTHSTQLFLMLWTIIIILFFSMPKSKTIGYILPVFPAISLLVGNFLSTTWHDIKQKSIRIGIVSYIISSFLIAIFGLLMLHYQFFPVNPAITPYLYVNAFLFLISGIIAIWSLSQKTLTVFFALAMTTMLIFLSLCNFNATNFNLSTAKPLVIELKTRLKPGDEVIGYFKYFSDVSFYLNKDGNIPVAADWQAKDMLQRDNWRRELWYGMQFQNKSDWLLDEDTFWKRFESKQHLFVFINDNYLVRFKKRAKKYTWIGQHDDIILVSNQ